MGSPLSPIAANIFMEYFEESFVMSSHLKPSLWIRYLDDCLVIWKHGKEELLKYLNYLNSCHKNIKFTFELEKDKQIPFLDILIIKRTDGTLGHTIYRKPTHTNKYLTAHKPHKKIKDFTNSAKDSIEAKNKCGVYKINCNCGLSYIGQTGRKIEERIKEHERNIRLEQTAKSAVAEHTITQGHEIEWEKSTLLHKNHRYKNRIITEAIEIHRHKNINFNREDAYPLSK
jgi:predicted GIY-YIG superfamily endonuclease